MTENEAQTAVRAMLDMAQRGWTVTLHPPIISATENPLWFQYRLEAVFAEDRTHRKRRASIIISARGSEAPAGMSSNMERAIFSLHQAVIKDTNRSGGNLPLGAPRVASAAWHKSREARIERGRKPSPLLASGVG